MAEGDFPKVEGDILYGTEANEQVGGLVVIEAGENITSGNVCYIHLTNGKAFISDTGTADDIRANGIALATVNAGNDVSLRIKGKFKTSGLVDKQDYYLGAGGALSTTLSGVRIGTALSTTTLLVDIRQDDRDAVGTIKAYLADISGIPSNNLTAFWQLMDGTTISDSESPLDGQTVRDLNANNEFLRGADTSGGTGGSTTTGTVTTGSNKWTNITEGGQGLDLTAQAQSDAGNHSHKATQPPFLDVVWIIKIK